MNKNSDITAKIDEYIIVKIDEDITVKKNR